MLSYEAGKITTFFLLFLLFCQQRVSFPQPAVNYREHIESLNRKHNRKIRNCTVHLPMQMKAPLFLAVCGFLCYPGLFPSFSEACLYLWDTPPSSKHTAGRFINELCVHNQDLPLCLPCRVFCSSRRSSAVSGGAQHCSAQQLPNTVPSEGLLLKEVMNKTCVWSCK